MSSDSLSSETWTDSTDELLKEIVIKNNNEIKYHLNKEGVYSYLKHILSIPPILIGCVMSILDESITTETVIKLCFLTMSMFNSLNMYFSADKKKYEHAIKINRYTSLNEKIEQVLCLERNKRPACREIFEIINVKLNSIRKLSQASNSPIK